MQVNPLSAGRIENAGKKRGLIGKKYGAAKAQ